MMPTSTALRGPLLPAVLLPLLACLLAGPAAASEFSVSPVRADLRPGALSETITVANRGDTHLRVGVKVMEWTQDAQGQDVYKETGDLVYFPRQMELAPEGRKLVRVGAKSPAGAVERSYRMFIEELPEASTDAARTQVSVYFRFGVPIFLTPAAPHAEPDIGQPTLDKGKLSLVVRNPGNQHFRILKLVVADGAGFSREVAGWYSLPGSQRTYALDLPREVCRQGATLDIAIEGEGLRADRKLHVDPARCS